MQKRVFIIHGWAGHPKECWFLWLKEELEKQGIKSEIPSIHDAEAPKIDKWVPFLEKLVGTPDKERLGAQTIIVKNKGHMGGSDNLKEYPFILEEMIKLMRQ